MIMIVDKKRSKPDSVDCTPPEFIMPGSKERPLLPLHPNIKDLKVSHEETIYCVFPETMPLYGSCHLINFWLGKNSVSVAYFLKP